jgi:hypothetical protein
VKATVKSSDPDGDALTTEWSLRREPAEYKEGGDREDPTAIFPEAIVRSDQTSAEVKMPSHPGGYRLYAIVRDGHGGGATANVPLLVEQSGK